MQQAQYNINATCHQVKVYEKPKYFQTRTNQINKVKKQVVNQMKH